MNTNKDFSPLQWVVQKNLNGKDSELIREACAALSVDFVEVDIIPFSNSLPEFPREKCSIFYGSITFNNLVYADADLNKGLFFNESFKMENYIAQWGEYMLNYGASITTFPELLTKNYSSDKLLFIRPNDDTKSFAGDVKVFSDIALWYEALQKTHPENLGPDTKILIGEPYQIKTEWRLWIVQGKVIEASKYRENFRLSKQRGCPDSVRRFAEARCTEYMPHDVFVMDIGLCGGDFYIIECGCMNGAGFYNGDISNIIAQVTTYMRTIV